MIVALSRALRVTLLLVVASVPLHAQLDLDALLPDEGTIGTGLDLRLMGDLGKGKPKVWLTLAGDAAPKPKKTKLKVGDVADLGGGLSSLAVSFKKTKTGAGLYDLHVKPKGKGQVEQVFEGAFTVRAPEVGTVSREVAEPKQEIMISGGFLGAPKKPKVFLLPGAGGKARKAKVRGVTAGEVMTVKLPKLADGVYDVVVANTVGEDVLPGALTIVGGGGGGGGSEHFSMTLASAQQSLLVTQFQANAVLEGFKISLGPTRQVVLTAGMVVGQESTSISLTFPFEPGVTPTPFTIEMGDDATQFAAAVSQSQPDADWYEGTDVVPGMLTVTSATANRVTGTFGFTLEPGSPSPAAGDLEITNGMFDVELSAFTP